MMEAKEEVRSRLNIEDVIGEYVQLKRAGRSFKGLSPFSGEKTPSFYVSPEKQIWHDFSSNKGGDVFSFVMEVEGLDFRGSLEYLARKANVDLSLYQSKGSQEIARRKKRAIEANNLAANYYQHCLIKNPRAVEYVFKKRGLSKEVVADFRLGYAPDQGDALVQFLHRKGFSRKDLDDAGLTNRFGGDLLRGRMTVPLMDAGGQVIGFTGRIIGEGDPNAPKYLNTPQTVLYDKSRHVFGLSQAKEAIRTSDCAVMVEGNLDVVSSHQAGIRNVIATAGTAMTDQHLQALRRLTGNVRLAFDGDKAGLAATERAIPIATMAGIELGVITLPGDAKDPDELIQQDPALWQQAIDSAQPALDWVMAQYARQHDLTDVRGKRAFTWAVIGVIKSLSDPIEQEQYMKKIAVMIGGSYAAVLARFNGEIDDEVPKPLKPVNRNAGKSDDLRTYDHLDTALGETLRNPLARGMVSQLPAMSFDDPAQQAVATYAQTATTSVTETPQALQNYDDYVKIVLYRAEERYGNWDDKAVALEVASILRKHKYQYEKSQLEQKINAAELAGDDDEVSRLRTLAYQMTKEMKRG